jgi:hypothetical protein
MLQCGAAAVEDQGRSAGLDVQAQRLRRIHVPVPLSARGWQQDMTFDALAHPRAPLMTLEPQGYTHLSWKCPACGLDCARGFSS